MKKYLSLWIYVAIDDDDDADGLSNKCYNTGNITNP